MTDRTQLANGAGYPNKPTALLNAFPFVGHHLGQAHRPENRPPGGADAEQPSAAAGRRQKRMARACLSRRRSWAAKLEPDVPTTRTLVCSMAANHWGMDYWTEQVTYKPGSAYLGQGFPHQAPV